MKFGILIKIFFFIAFPIYSLDFSLILGSSKYQSEKTLSLGTKLNFFIFTQAQDCFFSFCRTGTGAEIFYPSFLWNLELGIRFYSNRYTFTITGEYGESENLKGAYDIDFNTYIFTKYRKYSFTNIFNLKETIYDWKDYLIFFRSESHLIHRIYKLNFLYENQITNLFSLLFNGELEKSFYSLLNAYSIIPFRNFLLSNVNYLYNDYYIFSTGFSWYLFKNNFFNFQIGALFSLGVLHFDFYHTFRYLEFVGDNLGNGYRYFIKFSFPIQKNALFYIYFQKILFYSLTPKIAKGTEIKKYTINEIPNIIMYGGRGPDFFIHKQEEKFNIQYEYKFF